MTNRTIRLFVSSTFSDFKAERDLLQREVFPKLQRLCLSKGLCFQAIDLRWGVPEEIAIHEHKNEKEDPLNLPAIFRFALNLRKIIARLCIMCRDDQSSDNLLLRGLGSEDFPEVR